MKSFEIGYGDERVVIHPKMPSVAESDDVQRQLNDIADTDPDKYKLEFEICRDALDRFSAKPAEKLVKEKGSFKRVPLEGGIAAHFSEQTIENERVVRNAYQILISQFLPESRFI